MPYSFRRSEPVSKGIRRIAREQIERALDELNDSSLGMHESVHQARKRCKKIRALLRLVRPGIEPTYQFENAWFRDAGRILAPLRDAQSVLETYDELLCYYAEPIDRGELIKLRERLVDRRDRLVLDQHNPRELLEQFQTQLRTATTRIADWPVDKLDFSAVAAGLSKSYRRGRHAMPVAYDEQTPESFHEWRKRVKYHWYHLRLLKRTWPSVLKKRRKAASKLADLLGDDHDLSILDDILRNEFADEVDTPMLQAARGLILGRCRDLRRHARSIGERLYADKPKSLARRLERYWNTWRDDEIG